jgi:hypothetical protein
MHTQTLDMDPQAYNVALRTFGRAAYNAPTEGITVPRYVYDMDVDGAPEAFDKVETYDLDAEDALVNDAAPEE